MVNDTKPVRLLIIGRPRCGKTTLATRLGAEHGLEVTHLDKYLGEMPWSELSDWIAEQLAKDGNWIIEGCSGVRGLRKYLKANPNKPLPFEVRWLDDYKVLPTPKQHAFGTACKAIYNECTRMGVKL